MWTCTTLSSTASSPPEPLVNELLDEIRSILPLLWIIPLSTLAIICILIEHGYLRYGDAAWASDDTDVDDGDEDDLEDSCEIRGSDDIAEAEAGGYDDEDNRGDDGSTEADDDSEADDDTDDDGSGDGDDSEDAESSSDTDDGESDEASEGTRQERLARYAFSSLRQSDKRLSEMEGDVYDANQRPAELLESRWRLQCLLQEMGLGGPYTSVWEVD